MLGGIRVAVEGKKKQALARRRITRDVGRISKEKRGGRSAEGS